MQEIVLGWNPVQVSCQSKEVLDQHSLQIHARKSMEFESCLSNSITSALPVMDCVIERDPSLMLKTSHAQRNTSIGFRGSPDLIDDVLLFHDLK